MKTFIALSFLVLTSTSFAASSPILEDVVLKNKQFSQKIFDALGGKEVKGLISCKKTAKEVSCSLTKGGWNYFGNEAYGSGNQDKLTKKLYDSLSIKETMEDGMKFKTIELNVADPHGGTERNQISCTRVGKEAEQLGLRDTCQVLNAL